MSEEIKHHQDSTFETQGVKPKMCGCVPPPPGFESEQSINQCYYCTVIERVQLRMDELSFENASLYDLIRHLGDQVNGMAAALDSRSRTTATATADDYVDDLALD